MGFDPNVAIFFSGVGTLILFAFVGGRAMSLIAAVAVVLVAENLGHIKTTAAMTGRNLHRFLGRAFLDDGVTTMISASGRRHRCHHLCREYRRDGGHRHLLDAGVSGQGGDRDGTRPVAEIGRLVMTASTPVIGGRSVVVIGLISTTAGTIWVEASVDFSQTRNLITTAVTLMTGSGHDPALRRVQPARYRAPRR
jgi:xanthine/uracil permease